MSSQRENVTYSPNLTHQFNYSNITSEFGNYTESERYMMSPIRYGIYTGIRIIECIIGIIGNILTLIIIKALKNRTNGHTIMGYLAVFDILVSCCLPLAIYINATETIIEKGRNWKTLCILEEYTEMIAGLGSLLAYLTLSLDR